MILSILIPTLADRRQQLNKLLHTLNHQIGGEPVQVLTAEDSGEMTVGAKRQMLLMAAVGEYVCYFDDDDQPDIGYIPLILRALESRPDCVGFKGWYQHKRKRFEWIISNALPYVDAMINKQIVYLRHTNHLAPVRRDIALQIGFQDISREEDHRYAVGLRESGLLKTEVFINKHLYHYIK